MNVSMSHLSFENLDTGIETDTSFPCLHTVFEKKHIYYICH